MNRPPFFLVWCEDGGEPRHKHDTHDAAKREADRLARANPGSRFFVLTPLESVVRSDLHREQFDAYVEDVPF